MYVRGFLFQMKFKMIEVTDERNEDNCWDEDRNLPVCFCKRRHLQKIKGIDSITQSWRMKDRVFTFFFSYNPENLE